MDQPLHLFQETVTEALLTIGDTMVQVIYNFLLVAITATTKAHGIIRLRLFGSFNVPGNVHNIGNLLLKHVGEWRRTNIKYKYVPKVNFQRH